MEAKKRSIMLEWIWGPAAEDVGRASFAIQEVDTYNIRKYNQIGPQGETILGRETSITVAKILSKEKDHLRCVGPKNFKHHLQRGKDHGESTGKSSGEEPFYVKVLSGGC